MIVGILTIKNARMESRGSRISTIANCRDTHVGASSAVVAAVLGNPSLGRGLWSTETSGIHCVHQWVAMDGSYICFLVVIEMKATKKMIL